MYNMSSVYQQNSFVAIPEFASGIGIVSAMEVINEFSGEGIVKLQNLK